MIGILLENGQDNVKFKFDMECATKFWRRILQMPCITRETTEVLLYNSKDILRFERRVHIFNICFYTATD